MEKQKRWQLYLIIAVTALTLYNILPTIFYYSKPLRAPIDQQRSSEVANQIIHRVNGLEQDAVEWLYSFSNLLKLKPLSIKPKENNPGIIAVSFGTKVEADRFKRFLPRAGSLISFVPSQLSLYPDNPEKPETVFVEREIHVKLDPEKGQELFQYVPRMDNQGKISPEYRDIVFDRALNLAHQIAGKHDSAERSSELIKNMTDPKGDDLAVNLAQDLVEFERTFGKSPEILKRYYRSLTPEAAENFAVKLETRLDSAKQRLITQREALINEQAQLKKENLTLSPAQEDQLIAYDRQLSTINQAIQLIKKQADQFKSLQPPLASKEILTRLNEGYRDLSAQNSRQFLTLEGHNPFIKGLEIDWNTDTISLKLYDDISALRQLQIQSENQAFVQEKLNQYLINEVARIGRDADENFIPNLDTFAVQINQLPNTESLLKLNLSTIAAQQAGLIREEIREGFQPQNEDLKSTVYPIRDYATFQKESPEDQKLGFVIYAPAMEKGAAPEGFHSSSIYVIAKGMESILQKYRATPQAPESKQLSKDLETFSKLMQNMSFIGYPGASYGIDPQFAQDFIFELDDYYSPLIKASREQFEVKGSKHYATLPFTDVEQRMITLNKIEDQTQEDLLKWGEAYNSAQIDLDLTNHYLIPAPTKNPYWSNFKISFAKFFRGDDRKILKWGLDLSGGKTVRIGLLDHNNHPVKNPDDIKQAVNELYTRINKMGVSERTIRIENENIVLEFPGSQALSASDLVKASAMYFHVVNEKFGIKNPSLKEHVKQFLQNVWNEAVVTNRKDPDSIKEIAWQHLGGETLSQDKPRPVSESARILYENGLRLANPKTNFASNQFDDTLSTVAILRGVDFAEWEGQSNPLVIIFNNYALEGASLNNIQVGYDSTSGNHLSFGVKRSYDGSDRYGSPRDDFYSWTSQFAEDKIAGTQKETYSQGKGWRMAVILNGNIISSPELRAALRDSATITGRFSQREVNQLAADLKAGSLSFTPKILSEQNVSAELGAEERTSGIIASLVAIALVVIAMVAYYHFAGVIASIAVLFNIFIMWGVLQNLDAALTLPAIAGIVLTIGMAVDANVLVFERIREEFAVSGRIASAIQAGYRKAFSAIVDSNITTIIAALILIQFDSGPIKGFAVTLIVGIISSMFTALFLTRFYFAGWVQNPAHKSLSMAQFFQRTNIPFLKYSKLAIGLSIAAILLGMALLYSERRTILGMDFTGGYALNVEVEAKPGIEIPYRLQAIDALLAQGASPRDVQVRELTKPNQLKIQLGMGLEEKGQPFYQLPEHIEQGQFAYSYQENPRLVWVVKALEQGGLKISDAELKDLDSQWSVMSGQFSDTMRNNAIFALALALLSVLIYITFRFEFKYAVAAVVGLAHDVLITLGLLALFHALGFMVQIDLQVIGALMTIIGYSLNDTIIVFDRIREDIRLMRKSSFAEIINHALNITLSRTVMTSGTTILVLLALVFLGGQSIFAFSLVMTLGVIVGTLSSLFIAAPVLLYIHNREEAALGNQDLASKKA